MVDNHHTSNLIFSVMDVDGVRPVPPTVWDRVGEVREALYRAIEEFSPPDWSFVFTNALNHGVPADEAVISRLARLAAARGHPYVPVVLHCGRDEILRRVSSADRQDRMKWIDPEAVRAFMTERPELVRLDGYRALELDVTLLPPEQAATQILDHIGRF